MMAELMRVEWSYRYGDQEWSPWSPTLHVPGAGSVDGWAVLPEVRARGVRDGSEPAVAWSAPAALFINPDGSEHGPMGTEGC